MIAVARAWARSFWRDRPGVVLTLLLPPLVYLLFAAIFGAGARGEIDTTAVIHDAARTPATAAMRRALEGDMGRRLRMADSEGELERAVLDGRADAGILIRPSPGGPPRLIIVLAAGRDVAAAGLQARLEPMAATLAGQSAPRSARVSVQQIGPAGDAQSAYYAGAVSVMFVFFAAMHGAMGGLDERRSGLQARLALARGGLAPILAGRAAWLTMVGVMQTGAVFAAAWTRLPDLAVWQATAAAVTAVMVGIAAAGLALVLTAACRSRDQAQPLTTFVVLLLAALGGSMAPRFLMPEAFRAIGWATPHAWAIEAYQSVVWRGEFASVVPVAWVVLGAMGGAGWLGALLLERRRL
ncbi:ABC transporter permease [Brevundimonas sp. Leaf363]|uniref:ABC transporter permease n=1 Tax=Brevundimonas sp. Leaf363 TaxID=1736353 RepID=UPI0006F9BA2A|nr:ABC transporter permease [Brevundimonas sp. Leaf363]